MQNDLVVLCSVSNLQKSWNTKTFLECSFSDSDGSWVCCDGHGFAWLTIHWFSRGRDLLWSSSRCHSPHCFWTVWPEILWSHLQHSNPQPPPWLLPLLRPACWLVVWRPCYPHSRRWHHMHRPPLLQAGVRGNGLIMHYRVWLRRPTGN